MVGGTGPLLQSSAKTLKLKWTLPSNDLHKPFKPAPRHHLADD